MVADRYKHGTLAQRFSRYTEPREGGCVEWVGSRDKNGYGRITTKVDGITRAFRSHRLAWELAHGPIPAGLWVLHLCDNPPCVNLDHLLLGTARDNNHDMKAKGRARYVSPVLGLKGTSNPSSKLTDSDVRAIRARKREGASNSAVGTEFGVDPSTVSRIAGGER